MKYPILGEILAGVGVLALLIGCSPTAPSNQETEASQETEADDLAEPLPRTLDEYRWTHGDPGPSARTGTTVGAWQNGPERRAFEEWPGSGWFHMVVDVPEAWAGRQVALSFRHVGALEAWIDGRLAYRGGQPTERPAEEIGILSYANDPVLWSFEPGDALGSPTATGTRHLVALFYSSWMLDQVRFSGIDPQLAFRVEPVDTFYDRRQRQQVRRVMHRSVLFALPLAFALPHLILGLWRARNRRRHLTFASFAIALGVNAVTWFIRPTELWSRTALGMLFVISFLIAAISIIGFSAENYSTHQDPKRRRLLSTILGKLLGVLVVGVGVWGLVQPFAAVRGAMAVMVIAMIIAAREATRSESRPHLLMVLGTAPSIIVGLLYSLIGLGVIPSPWDFMAFPAPYYASLILMATMSLDLGRDFARTQEDLEIQLERVSELSEEALENERRLRHEAVERARIEAENERRGRELHEAREQQLAMLPAQLEAPSGYRVAAHMSTATEVGGDYYDVVSTTPGRLLAIGDATGHGLQAGTVVAATKSLFQALGPDADSPADLLGRMSRALRAMGLERRQMALGLIHVEGETLRLSAAAMPPAYIVRRGGGLEAVDTASLPLGSFIGDYQDLEHRLAPGDLLIASSDGLAESLNVNGDVMGYERLEESVAMLAGLSAEPALEALLAVADAWRGGRELADDLTVLILERL